MRIGRILFRGLADIRGRLVRGMDSGFLDRHVRPDVVEALGDTRVVVVLGARQVGKSTLVQRIARHDRPMALLTLDDRATRQAARDDPTGFIADLTTPVVVDEVQRVPDLLLAIKQRVDEDRRPGQFLLTGSANILTAPRIADALTGRAEYYRLWPFTQGELRGVRETFIPTLFAGAFPQITGAPIGRRAHASLLISGGYPAAQQRTGRRRVRFFESYLDTIIRRDLSSIAKVHEQGNVRRLLQATASISGSLMNYDGLSRDLGLPASTLRPHTDLLETLFLIRRMRPWHNNLLSRVIKTPKVYVTDSGLLAYLLGADEKRVEHDSTVTGMLYETFAVTELLRQSEWQTDPVNLHHYRDKDGREIDAVLERRDGAVIGIEVKSAASVGAKDFGGLRRVRDALGERFKAGAVIYTGANTLPFGDRLAAIPLSGLWATA
jgi:predicted AAA+ superfamily ATPase